MTGKTTTRPRPRATFLRDAARYAKTCGEQAVPWEDVEPKILGGCAVAGIEPTGDERMDIFESWLAAYPFEEPKG